MTNLRSSNLKVLGEACCQTADRKSQQLTQEPPRCTVWGLTFSRTSLLLTLVNISTFSLMNLFTLHNSTVINGEYQQPQPKDGRDQDAPPVRDDIKITPHICLQLRRNGCPAPVVIRVGFCMSHDHVSEITCVWSHLHLQSKFPVSSAAAPSQPAISINYGLSNRDLNQNNIDFIITSLM